MGFVNEKNIVAWQVKGKTICSSCLMKGEKADRVLTDADCTPGELIACDRCGEVLYDDLEALLAE